MSGLFYHRKMEKFYDDLAEIMKRKDSYVYFSGDGFAQETVSQPNLLLFEQNVHFEPYDFQAEDLLAEARGYRGNPRRTVLQPFLLPLFFTD